MHQRFSLRATRLVTLTSALTQTSTASDWRAAPPPPIRAGVGDSLGNALFMRQIQLAKSLQFQTAPSFASEHLD